MRVLARNLLLLSAVLGPAVFGQAAAAAGNPSEEEKKTVQIVLYPAPEPRPALKYQLLPPFLERRPGNAAVWWNGIPGERTVFFAEFDKEWENIITWLNIPLNDPREKAYRAKELATAIQLLGGGGVFSDMARAAQFESCDWQLPIRDGNFIAIPLPNVQHAREYARLLAAKAHLQIAEGKYVEAVRTLQTGYAEARHVAEGQTLINSLVGVTIAGMMSDQVQQLIQQPGAPNLYWALSSLPRPLVDFRPGVEAESNLLCLQFPELRDLDKKTLSPDEWRELLRRIVNEYYPILNVESPLPRAEYQASITLTAISGYPSAKRYLVEHGRTAAEVEAMPVAQVVLLYTVSLYDELSDEQFKWFYLPFTEGGAALRRANRDLREALAAEHEIIPFAAIFLPASAATKEAETRLQWVMASLRIFEAMRLYAANHEGRWPDRLSDITEVPVPLNPYDGKPFLYERQGDKVLLTVENGPQNFHRRFEITLRQKRS